MSIDFVESKNNPERFWQQKKNSHIRLLWFSGEATTQKKTLVTL
jgi:hypothetical protein